MAEFGSDKCFPSPACGRGQGEDDLPAQLSVRPRSPSGNPNDVAARAALDSLVLRRLLLLVLMLLFEQLVDVLVVHALHLLDVFRRRLAVEDFV